MSLLTQDLRFGFRMLRKTPGLTSAAIVTLALGIGANTAIFSVVEAVLLRPLPYREPSRLVRVYGNYRPRGLMKVNLSPLDVADFGRESRSFEGLASFNSGSRVLTGLGEARPARVGSATPGAFALLGVKPVEGRFFAPGEGRKGAEPVAVISDAFWRSTLGGDPRALGRSLVLEGVPHRIVGILPPSFRTPVPGPPGEPEIWRPLALPSNPGARGGHYVQCIGRLKAGIPAVRAQAELDTLAAKIERLYPDTSTGWRTTVVPLRASLVGDVRAGLLALAAAVGLLLAVACANVASLLLGKAAGRAREIAVRRALGAGAWHLVRQLLAESLMLSAAGGAAGLLVGSWTLALLLSAASSSLPPWAVIRMDGTVLAFTLGVALLAGILTGLAPAFQGLRHDPGSFLLQGGERTGSGPKAGRLRGALVTGQVALSIVLLSGAALFLQSLHRLLGVDAGFDSSRVMTLQISLPPASYPDEGRGIALYGGRLERVESMPSVRGAGVVTILPLSGGYSGDSFLIDEHPAVRPGEEPTAEHRAVSPGYFAAMGIPLLKGRLPGPRDGEKAPPVAVINQAMARAFFLGEDPLGKHLRYNGVPREIVGVVGNVHHFGLDQEVDPEYYFPFPQDAQPGMTLVVRSKGDPHGILPSLRAALRGMDPDLAAADALSLDDLIARSVAQPRFRTLLLASFASLALLLAAVGIYGIVAYGVSRRTREMGVRLALGAQRSDLLSLVIGQGMKQVAAGAVLGVLGALASSRAISGLLFQVRAADLRTLAGVSLLLAGVALAACYVPARRATRVDPAEALKCE